MNPMPPRGDFQDNDRVLLNMYNMHLFYLEVIDEMEKVIKGKSENKKYGSLGWSEEKATLFIEGVKHYMNPEYQKKSFDFAREKCPSKFDL